MSARGVGFLGGSCTDNCDWVGISVMRVEIVRAAVSTCGILDLEDCSINMGASTTIKAQVDSRVRRCVTTLRVADVGINHSLPG